MRFILLTWLLCLSFIASAQCGLDVFVANDQSGSIDAVENSQGRDFITTLMEELGPWGTANNQSRMAIAQWSDAGTWVQYNFPGVGQNYTTLLSDVIAHQNSPRTLSGGTDPYQALLKSYQVIHQTAVSGRRVSKVLILMTDASCGQIQSSIVDLAQDIKDEGIYLMVLAIDAAESCTILQDENVASPGGFFSAGSYAELQAEALQYVKDIVTNGCVGPPPPSPDLTIDLTAYMAANCNSAGIGTYKVDYAINNVGEVAWNNPVTISFYDGDPTRTGTHFIAKQALGVRNIPAGGNITGSYSNGLLLSSSRLFAVVNFDGSLPTNAPPLAANIKDQLLVGGERSGRNNVSGQIKRGNDASCLPKPIVQVNVQADSIGCGNAVNYNVEICNTGDTVARIDSVVVVKPHLNFTLKNNPLSDSTVRRLWGTFYNVGVSEYSNDIKTDLQGNVYLVGEVSGYPSGGGVTTPGSHQPDYDGGTEGFLFKFDSTGVRLWSTYYGGDRDDGVNSLAIDAQGNLYIAGYAVSNNAIATNGSHQPTYGGGDKDGFIAKFNSSGVRQWATYYGGTKEDEIYGITLDATGNIYVVGATNSTSGISTTASHQATFGGGDMDGFLAKFNSMGVRQWATYYGGAGSDYATKLKNDIQGNIFFAGSASSENGIATPGSYQPDPVGSWYNGILVKFNSSGVRQWGTYQNVGSQDLVIDHSGNIYLCGETEDHERVATPGSHQTDFGGGEDDGILAKFNKNGLLDWATNYGGTGRDNFQSLAVDMQGNIYGSGITNSPNAIATPGSHKASFGGRDDAFLVKFNSTGVRQWATYYGGDNLDDATAMTIDGQGKIYIAGFTYTKRPATDIATPGTYQPTASSLGDLFIAKFTNTYGGKGFFLDPGQCAELVYGYSFNNVPSATYNFSAGVYTPSETRVLPDSNFTAGGLNLDGFNGSFHTSDDVTISGSSPACPIGDQVKVGLNIPTVSGCGAGNYAQATITITNTSGVTIYNPSLFLNLTGIGSVFAGEIYSLTNGLKIALPDLLSSSYPNVPYSLYRKAGQQRLPIWELPSGTSTFQVDIELGTTLTNLEVRIDQIPPFFNVSGSSNLAKDAEGVTISPIPTITGFNCPTVVNYDQSIVFTGINVGFANAVKWNSSSVANIVGGGTISNPTLTYLPTPMDAANRFVALSLTATNASGCETTRSCQISLAGVKYDFGDAPESYDLNTNDFPYAATSTLLTGLHIGTVGPSSESVGKSNSNASGDGVEEDGFRSPSCGYSRPVPRQQYNVSVQATNTTANKAYLSGFLDFNNDGDYLDDSERVVRILPVNAFSNVQNYILPFVAPRDVHSTATKFFVRFRISTDSNAIKKSYESAPQGEVEDHQFTIGVTQTVSQNLSICQGQSVTVGTSVYTVGGTYTDTLPGSAGCDSIVISIITEIDYVRRTVNRSICQGESINIYGHVYTTAGTYRDTVVAASGCDSIITTNLTVNPVVRRTTNPSICQGQSITVGTHTYTVSGTYIDTLTTSRGCDSIITTNLTVTATLRTTINPSICEGESVTVGTSVYTLAGTYRDTLSSSRGCDSIVTTNLTVKPVVRRNTSPAICEGESITVGTHTYSVSGTYRDTVTAANGCDSIITTTLTVRPTVRRTTNPILCQGQSVTVGGHVYSTTGTYRDTLQAASGCDSIITTNLTVNPVWRITTNRGICQGQSITVGGNVYTVSGTYIDSLTSSRGCDSIITTNLTVSSFIRNTINPSICEGESVTVGTSVYNATGTYSDTLTSPSGCDSIVTTNLTVHPTVRTSGSFNICEGQSVTIGGSVYTTTGIYNDTLTSLTGCDSIVTTDLVVRPASRVSLQPVICEGQTYTVGTSTYSFTGSYLDTLTATNGCDSIITTGLLVIPAVVNISASICEGDTTTVENQIFSEAGTYTVVLVNSLGCDSTVNLTLSVNPSKTTDLELSICEGEVFTIGQDVFDETGQYSVLLTSATGCDSTVNLSLSVNTPPQIDAEADPDSVEETQEVQLSVNDLQGNTYSWTPSQLVSDPAIADPVATITEDTWFYVTVTDANGCESIDSVFVQFITHDDCNGINIFIPSAFTPNGDGQNDVLRVRSSESLESMRLVIYNSWGEKVFESTDQSIGWDGIANGNLSSGDNYGYYFEGSCGEKMVIKKGVVVLIR